MGIYIKGVEMPTGNDELRLIIRSNGQVIISHKTFYDEAEAVPVPPHGRLVDGEDVYHILTNYYHHTTEVQHYDLREALSRVSTIIPAEEDTP